MTLSKTAPQHRKYTPFVWVSFLYPFLWVFFGVAVAVFTQQSSGGDVALPFNFILLFALLFGLTFLNMALGAKRLKQWQSLVQPTSQLVLPVFLEQLLVFWRRFTGVSVLLLLGFGWFLWVLGTPVFEVFFYITLIGLFLAPEGAVLAVLFAYGRFFKKAGALNVHLKNVQALENIGACEALFTEKTKALTLGSLSVQVVLLTNGQYVLLKGVGFDASKRKEMLRLATVGLLSSPTGSLEGVDLALLRFAKRMHLNRAQLLRHCPQQAAVPFTQQQGYSASFHMARGQVYAAVKGAPEVIAKMCGTPKAPWLAEVANLAEGQYRVIALAGGPVPAADEAALKAGTLTFLGLIALADPLQEGAVDAVAELRTLGVDTCLLTGEHPATALVFAKNLGIAGRQEEVLSANQLPQFYGEIAEGAASFSETSVFARFTPQDKQAVLQHRAAHGPIAALTCKPFAVGTASLVKMSINHLCGEADLIIPEGKITPLPALFNLSRHLFGVVQNMVLFWFALGVFVVTVSALGFWGLRTPPINTTDLALTLVLVYTVSFALAFKNHNKFVRRPYAEKSVGKIITAKPLLRAAVLGGVAAGLLFGQVGALAFYYGGVHSVEELSTGLLGNSFLSLLVANTTCNLFTYAPLFAMHTRPKGEGAFTFKGWVLKVLIFVVFVGGYGALYTLLPQKVAPLLSAQLILLWAGLNIAQFFVLEGINTLFRR